MTFSFTKPPAPIRVESAPKPVTEQENTPQTTPDPVVNPDPAPAAVATTAVEPAAPISVAGLPAVPQRFNVQVTAEPAADVNTEAAPEPSVANTTNAATDESNALAVFFGFVTLLAFSGAKFILTHTFTLVVTLLTYVDEDIKAKYIKA